MRRWFATVRVRTTVFATLVVTAALVAGAHPAPVRAAARARGGRRAERAQPRRRRRRTREAGSAPDRRSPRPRRTTRSPRSSTRTGLVVAASQNLRGEPGVDARRAPAATLVISTSSRHSTAGSGSRPGPSTRRPVALTVYAGDNLETVGDATQQLATLLGFGLPLLVGLVAAHDVAGHRAGRCDRWRRSGPRSLRSGRRICTAGCRNPRPHDEVGRLARTMNAMLARLDDAADRQRRFVSDASHELQSPLTSLRGPRSR